MTLTQEQQELHAAMCRANGEATRLAGLLWDSLKPTDEENQRVTDSLYDQAHDVGGEVMAEDATFRVEELIAIREMNAEDEAIVEQARAIKDAAEAEPRGQS